MFRTIRRAFNYLFHPNTILIINTMKRDWYHDIPGMILHANMKLLSEFVEGDVKSDIVDWQGTPETAEAYRIFMSIYNWWKFDPLARDDSILDTFYKVDPILGARNGRIVPMTPVEIRFNLLYRCTPENYNFWESSLKDIPSDYNSDQLMLKIEEISSARRMSMLKSLMDVREFLWI